VISFSDRRAPGGSPFRATWTSAVVMAWVLGMACSTAPLQAAASANGEPLRLSVYATAGEVASLAADPALRQRVWARLQQMGVTRVFLEGRRGDEYVPAAELRRLRQECEHAGLAATGGIATVPGTSFGVRQDTPLTWLNWQNPKSQRDVAGFFSENAPVFDALIVDDFYCTADTSAESEQARAGRAWGDYRRDLLVSLIRPMMVEPARRARAGTKLILKFPQWYDRFHLFGYDPARMPAFFDQIWVGTEVRDPLTRRMGFVQPTEGYINYAWIRSAAGKKVRGAWFDHIECSAENFVDQAYQSVLAGARELTLFHLGDLMQPHPGDALLERKWAGLQTLAAQVQRSSRQGVAFYKPTGSDPGANMYLADFLAVLGWPILPVAAYPRDAAVVFLGEQAAADPGVFTQVERSLWRGATVVVTPGWVRRVGPRAAELAGVEVGSVEKVMAADRVMPRGRVLTLSRPADLDGSLQVRTAKVVMQGAAGEQDVVILTERPQGDGRVLVLNMRTFSDAEFQAGDEWLLAPRELGWSELPQVVADDLRRACWGSVLGYVEAPARVSVCLFAQGAAVHNFNATPAHFLVRGHLGQLAPHECRWLPRK